MGLMVYKAIHKTSREVRMIKAISKAYLSKEENEELITELKALKELV